VPDSRLSAWITLAALMAVGFFLRTAGLDAPSLHPDEPTIARWVGTVAEQGAIQDRLYPGGFFRLAAPIRQVGRTWQGVRAAAARHTGAADRVADAWDDLRFARWMNAGLSLLTLLGVYALTLRLSGSRLAALAAAAFCAFDPISVEHAHYAETDTAMLAALVLTLAAWARARATGQALFVLAGAAAAGLAAGTKFTLVLLFVPTLLMPFLCREEDRGRRRLPRVLALTLLSLLLAAAVFAWTNPVFLQPAEFRAGLLQQSRGLFMEMRTAMGPAGETAAGRLGWKLRLLALHAKALGPLWGGLVLAGLAAFLAAPRFRRSWPLLALVPLLLIAQYLGPAPFIRKQEFLAFLPFLAILAALPLALPHPAWKPGRLAIRAAAALLLLAALDRALDDARRVSGLFAWKDPRLLARAWSDRHAPLDKTAAVEQSARPAEGNAYAGCQFLTKVEDLHRGFGQLEENAVAYLYRNRFTGGRGFSDPGSNTLRPRHAALAAAFEARAIPLQTWAPFDFPRANASHAGHGITLYALDPPRPRTALSLVLADPVLVSETGHETAFPPTGRLGGREAVQIGEQPREIAMGGPGPGLHGLSVTLATADREADLFLRAWGRTTRVSLPPESVRTVDLIRPRGWRTPEPYARLQAWSAPITGLDSPPCWLRLGAEEAVESPYTLGHAAAALHAITDPDRFSPLDRFRIAVRAQDWPRAAAIHSDACAALESLDAAIALPPSEIAINGIPGVFYNDFARLRAGPPIDPEIPIFSDHARKNDSAFRRAMRESILSTLGRASNAVCVSESPLVPPFRLAQGRFTLRLEVRPGRDDLGENAGTPETDAYELVDARGRTLAQGRWSDLARDRDTSITVTLAAGRESAPALFLLTPAPRQLTVRRMELTWTLHDRLRAVRQDLAACFARFALEQGKPEEARRALEAAPMPAWNDTELARLRRWTEARSMPGPVEGEFRFMPSYRLVDHAPAPAEGLLRLTLAALRDDTPPHEIQLLRRRGRRWKTAAAAPLHPGRFLEEGERVTVALPLPEGRPADWGLRVRTAILSRPGALTIPNTTDTVLPLSELRGP